MKQKELIYGMLGLIIGGLLTYLTLTQTMNTANNEHVMPSDSSHTMQGMTDALKEKHGDAFDETFLETMIEHHQGAIDMAKEVKKKAAHQELKTMADAIITAQSQEIKQMETWQKEWGYLHQH